MGAKKKQPARASTGSVWKRIALLSILVNVALGIFFLDSRSGTGEEREAITRFLDTYFRTWSGQDMEGYRNCFHPEATIHFIDSSGVPRGDPLENFIQTQRVAHANATVPMREVPLEKEVKIDGNVARALVRWKIYSEEGEEVGTDYFDLVHSKTGWKIVSLIFRYDG